MYLKRYCFVMTFPVNGNNFHEVYQSIFGGGGGGGGGGREISEQCLLICFRSMLSIICKYVSNSRKAIQAATLRKHAYSYILKILPPKNWKFSDENSVIFHISAQNIDCGYSLEPPHYEPSHQDLHCLQKHLSWFYRAESVKFCCKPHSAILLNYQL